MADRILSTSGIYAIVNKSNGKKYVGSAINISARWRRHRWMLTGGKHHSRALQQAWCKYGEDQFEIVVLEEIAEQRSLIEREQYWIDRSGAFGRDGYNVCPRAGSILGVKRTPETIEKMRASGRRYRATEETMERLRLANTGKKASPEKLAKMSALVKSPETIERLRLAGTGRKLSQESIEKMRAYNLGRKKSAEAREKMRLAKLGKKQSPEHIENRMKKIRGRKQPPEEIESRKAILATKLASKTQAP